MIGGFFVRGEFSRYFNGPARSKTEADDRFSRLWSRHHGYFNGQTELNMALSSAFSALEVWQEMLPGRPLPFAAVGVPRHMPAPGVSVLLDLWVYVPGRE